MKALKLICIIFLSFNLSAKALIRNVPGQYSTIQSGINACSNSDTLLVQPGTYFENINFRGRKIVLTSLFYQNNNYSFIQSTIINGSTPLFPDSASCVIINNHEDSTTVLQGFTLTGGTGTKWFDEHGAGLYREGGGLLIQFSSPVIQYNIISDNHSIPGGGAMSTGGGGMRIGDGYPRVHNNIVIGNSGRYGAGVVLNYTGGEYKNNLICKNFGSQDFGAGSGLWINSSFTRPITVENNSIVFNSAISNTAGIYGAGNTGIIRNNIVWGNTSTSSAQINASGMTVRYCDVQGGFPGAGNVNIDPAFDSTNYYLKSNSPLVDKGDSSVIYNDPPDPANPTLAKWPARGLLRNDIGAYGGPGSSQNAGTVVAVKNHDETFNPGNFYLKQNFPNPFNPNTIINYQCSMTGYVSIKVYDILGNIVATLVNQKQNPGNYSVEFNGANYPSGIYYYKLESGSFSEVRKMILLK